MYITTLFIVLATIATATCFVMSKIEKSTSDQNWWKCAVFYQIYPRSFKDSNNDGVGDLQGVLEKLTYIKTTGVTAIWLSPIMKSPQVDQGYDISDYYTVDPIFGTMEEYVKIIEKSHDMKLKVILDFVPNHTSDQHEWFLASENGIKDYKDYYVWADGTKERPPNNWISAFKYSAWTWSEKRQQYYLHQYTKAQPDLNFRNPRVRNEMKKLLLYYMDLNIDGFRIDAASRLVEDEQLRDEPRSNNPDATEHDPEYLDHIYTRHLPETLEILYEWRKLVDDYSLQHGGDARILMTEVNSGINEIMPYYGTKDGKKLGAHFTLNFNLIYDLNLDKSTAYDVKHAVDEWLDNIPGIYTSNWVLGNHDRRRVTTRFGKNNVDGFNMLMALLPGIGVTYNGEEFGQEDGEVKYEEGQDPSARNKSIFKEISRDFERTPLQWDDTINAGFNTGAKPWLPVSEKYKTLNLASQLVHDDRSHFRIYQQILKKRRDESVMNGTTEFQALSEDVILLKRSSNNLSVLLVFKLGWNGSKKESVSIPNMSCKKATVAITSIDSKYYEGSSIDIGNLELQAHESLILDTLC